MSFLEQRRVWKIACLIVKVDHFLRIIIIDVNVCNSVNNRYYVPNKVITTSVVKLYNTILEDLLI